MNTKQAAFAREYLVDRNATQAAKRAGYSEKTAHAQGHDLLKHPEVQAEIQQREWDLAEKVEMDAVWVLEQLRQVYDMAMLEPKTYASAARALELIGKHLGMFTERHQVDVRSVTYTLDLGRELEES